MSVTPHQVTNELILRLLDGYLLDGKFTPLQVIMAAMDTLAAEKKASIMNASMIIDGLAMALFALAAVHLPEIIVYLDYLININLGE